MSNNDPCNTDRPVRCLQRSLVRPEVAGVVTASSLSHGATLPPLLALC